METGCNMTESSKEGYGSETAVLPVVAGGGERHSEITFSLNMHSYLLEIFWKDSCKV
jgi:hypothetical protein